MKTSRRQFLAASVATVAASGLPPVDVTPNRRLFIPQVANCRRVAFWATFTFWQLTAMGDLLDGVPQRGG